MVLMERREALASFGPTSAGVPWPFDRVRDGQSDFLVDARRSLSEGKHLLAHAPTGLGKTAVALVAALDYGLAADKLVLFLTSRQSHHRIAIETIRRIEERGLRIPPVDLIAKHLMRLQEAAPSHGRAHLVGDLSVLDVLRAAKEARSIDGEVAQELVAVAKSLERFVTSLRSERIARKDEFLDVVEEGLRTLGGDAHSYASFVEGVAFAGEDAVRRGVPTHLGEVAEFLVR